VKVTQNFGSIEEKKSLVKERLKERLKERQPQE
jgi:hypothetical protein